MSKVQTDNSFLGDKIALRLNHIPKKEKLVVLDAFHGSGSIWKNIEKQYDGKIIITKIDKLQKDQDSFVLLGDNKKFMESMDLDKFDIIDLDSYGVPYEQLKIISQKKFKGIVFVTFIQTMFGGLPDGMLVDLGFTINMIKKIPSLFYRDGISKMLWWLNNNNINYVIMRRHSKKYYFAFRASESASHSSGRRNPRGANNLKSSLT